MGMQTCRVEALFLAGNASHAQAGSGWRAARNDRLSL